MTRLFSTIMRPELERRVFQFSRNPFQSDLGCVVLGEHVPGAYFDARRMDFLPQSRHHKVFSGECQTPTPDPGHDSFRSPVFTTFQAIPSGDVCSMFMIPGIPDWRG